MAESTTGEKTELPTGRRLNEAKKKGQVPMSQELTSAVTLITLIGILALMAPNLIQWFTLQMREGMGSQISIFTNNKTYIHFINGKIIDSMIICCPILAALMCGSILATVAVSGLNYAPEALEFKWDQLSPGKGLSNFFNAKTFVNLGISILKLLFVSIIVWVYLKDKIHDFAELRWAWSMQILISIAMMIFGVWIRICVGLIVIGVIDTMYNKWKYIEDLKMTKQEVKEDHKASEGSPETKIRIRRLQFAMASKRMLAEVPKANIVLVNPTHVAVAIKYDAKTMDSPIVVAKGADHLAEKIREVARAYGVPIIRRPELARTIYSTVKIDSAIPHNLYIAVAEILAMIYRLRHRRT